MGLNDFSLSDLIAPRRQYDASRHVASRNISAKQKRVLPEFLNFDWAVHTRIDQGIPDLPDRRPVSWLTKMDERPPCGPPEKSARIDPCRAEF